MFMMTPAFAMLFNTKLKRWHPIMFVESPLPGPHAADKPIRLKSKGHHTVGYESREAALQGIKEASAKIEPMPIVDAEKDIPWDGNGIPDMICFASENKLVFL